MPGSTPTPGPDWRSAEPTLGFRPGFWPETTEADRNRFGVASIQPTAAGITPGSEFTAPFSPTTRSPFPTFDVTNIKTQLQGMEETFGMFDIPAEAIFSFGVDPVIGALQGVFGDKLLQPRDPGLRKIFGLGTPEQRARAARARQAFRDVDLLKVSDIHQERPFLQQLAGAAVEGFGGIARRAPRAAALAGVRAVRVEAPQVAANIIGLRTIEPGLTRAEFLRRQLSSNTVGRLFRMAQDHELATPAIRERVRVQPAIDSSASALGTQGHYKVLNEFAPDESGAIKALEGIDPTLDGAPTIQDVAARLPVYAGRLNPKQAQVMEWLQDQAGPYKSLLDETGVETNFRSDIMEGGFYLPRGTASPIGYDEPLHIATRVTGRGTKKGFERAASRGSMAQGINQGDEYPPFGDALTSYARDAGNRAADAHVANYFRSMVDEGGESLLGSTPKMRVDPALRSAVEKLRNQIQGRRITLLRQGTRTSGASRTADISAQRSEKAVKEAGDQPVGEIRRNITTDISELRDFAYRHGRNRELLRQAKSKLSAQEKKAYDRLAEIEAEANMAHRLIGVEETSRAAEGLAEVGHGTRASRPTLEVIRQTQRNIDALMRDVDKLADTIDASATRVDDLIEQGDIHADVQKAAREAIVEGRRTERIIMDRDRLIRLAERDLGRYQRLAIREGETEAVYNDLRDQLRDLTGRWKHELALAQSTPRDMLAIPDLPGMQGWAFPEEIANAVNKEFRRGPGESLNEAIGPLNDLYRGVTLTLDNSAPGIQGLMAFHTAPGAWRKAMKTNIQAWGRNGEQSLGRFLENFDFGAKELGRLTASEWATLLLRIGGAETEFQVGRRGFARGLAKTPGIRVANRAFGYFGDALRLQWADELLAEEMKRGRTLQEILESGDAAKIADVVNNMTGWSKNRFGGSWGDLFLLAPRFFQSRLETVAKGAMGLRPGAAIDQRIARRKLLRTVGTATILTYFANEACGEETDLQPIRDGKWNPNFNRIRCGERDVSLLGPWDSLARLIVTTAQGKPAEGFRGLSSGTVSGAWDLISGRDFVGRPVRDNPQDFAEWIFRTMTPISAEEIPQIIGQSVEAVQRDRDLGAAAAGALAVGGELSGLKSSQLSSSEKREVARQRAVTRVHGEDKKFDDLNLEQQAAIDESDEDVIAAKAEMEKRGLERKSEFYQYKAERDKTRTASNNQVAELAAEHGPSRKFRDGLKTRRIALYAALDQLERSNQEMLDDLKEPVERNDYAFDRAYNEYVKRIFDEEGLDIDDESLNDSKTGEYNYRERARRLDDIVQKHGESMIARVEDFIHRKEAEVAPILAELREDRAALQRYWDLPRIFAGAYGVSEEYDAFMELGPKAKREARKDNPVLASALRASGRAKRALRMTEPEIDRLLLKWEYVTEAVNPQVIREQFAPAVGQ